MKRLFVDTNILVDLIADRQPFSKFAIILFEQAEKKKIRLYTSSHSIETTHYLLKKYLDEKKLREVLYQLLDFVTVIPVELETIKRALKSKHKDFEDAIQITCACSIAGMDGIVTRNIRDYKNSEIPVYSPDRFMGP